MQCPVPGNQKRTSEEMVGVVGVCNSCLPYLHYCFLLFQDPLLSSDSQGFPVFRLLDTKEWEEGIKGKGDTHQTISVC